MPYTCRLVDREELRLDGIQPSVGDMWFAPWYIEGQKPFILSLEYYRDWYDKRPPLVVVLPTGDSFMVDMRFSDLNGGFKENGWTITGEAPNITVNPSINHIATIHSNGYHGWLKDGILSDDLEGRTYTYGK